MLPALILIVIAGFGRENTSASSRGFMGGLIMALLAGVLQVGLSFSFVYCYEPINNALNAGRSGTLGELVGIWAFVLPGGIIVNLSYVVWMLYRNRSFAVFIRTPREILLSVLIGLLFTAFLVSLGWGMRLLGSMGASIGFGVYQTMQLVSAQILGFLSGEWRNSDAGSTRQICVAVILMLLAVTLFSAGKL